MGKQEQEQEQEKEQEKKQEQGSRGASDVFFLNVAFICLMKYFLMFFCVTVIGVIMLWAVSPIFSIFVYS